MDLSSHSTAIPRRISFALGGMILLFSVGCMSQYGQGPYGPGGMPITLIPGDPNGGGTTVVNYPPGTPYPLPGTVPSVPSTPGSPNTPSPPSGPVAGPVPTPPVNPNPVPAPVDPTNDPSVAGAPWPLPPINGSGASLNMASLSNIELTAATGEEKAKFGQPNRSLLAKGSQAAKRHHKTAGLPGKVPLKTQLADGLTATPSEDLKYRGGKTLQSMSYVNLFVAGDTAWKQEDMQAIDHALAAAMTDQHLNNVIMQYFNNQPVTTTPLPSHPLVGYKPGTVTQGDVHYFLAYLYQQNYLKSYDLNTTVFNFLLPPGTVLNDDPNRSGKASTENPAQVTKNAEEKAGDGEGLSAIPKADEGDSKSGLGGYHGSIHVGNVTLYYSVDVFSERRPDGTTNGIPVFDQSWKNVVATLYHELQEARTDPDVEDAIRNSTNPQAERYLGWTSDRGEEIGDFPLEEADQLKKIIMEVPLADGSGMVPIQLQYSNAVHGPEGPIPAPHPLQ